VLSIFDALRCIDPAVLFNQQRSSESSFIRASPWFRFRLRELGLCQLKLQSLCTRGQILPKTERLADEEKGVEYGTGIMKQIIHDECSKE
jgi:hypothetical protein